MDTAERVDVIVPQANDIDKILDLPLAIAKGANSKNLIIRRYDFDGRQADYYLEAAEVLGLVQRESGMYLLTEDGMEYQRMSPQQRKMMVASSMISVPIVAIILGRLMTSNRKLLPKTEVESLIKKYTRIRGTTVKRRANCVIRWLEWIGVQTGTISIDGNSIRLNTASTASSQQTTL